MVDGKTSLEHHIRIEYNSLTRGQKRIAEYLLSHLNEMHFLSSKQMAESVGVSESAVVRFSQRLGFTGYPALRKQLRNEFRARAGHEEFMTSGLRRNIEETNIVTDVIWRDIELLSELHHYLDYSEVEEAARRISLAKKVLAIGHRTSFGFAEFFASALRQGMGKGTSLSFGIGMATDVLVSVESETVVLAVTLSPASEQTVAMLRTAKDLGLYTIVITDQKDGEVGNLADTILLVDTDIQVFTSSYISVLATIHVLLTMVGRYAASESREFLDKVDQQRSRERSKRGSGA